MVSTPLLAERETVNLGNEPWPPYVLAGDDKGTAELIVCEALDRAGWCIGRNKALFHETHIFDANLLSPFVTNAPGMLNTEVSRCSIRSSHAQRRLQVSASRQPVVTANRLIFAKWSDDLH